MLDVSFVPPPLVPDWFYLQDIVSLPDGKFLVADGTALRRYREVRGPAVFAFGEKVVTATEGRQRFAALTIYRCGDVHRPGSVIFSTVEAESTAQPGRDYRPVNQRIRFGRGDWKRTVLVPLRDDPVADGTQTVVVRLHHPDATSVVYAVDTAAVRLIDNE
jgi:hypothetical protein